MDLFRVTAGLCRQTIACQLGKFKADFYGKVRRAGVWPTVGLPMHFE